jgi:hypothetical protein
METFSPIFPQHGKSYPRHGKYFPHRGSSGFLGRAGARRSQGGEGVCQKVGRPPRPCVAGESSKLAEREGFEPPEPCGSPVFKTGAFGHSAISPRVANDPTLPNILPPANGFSVLRNSPARGARKRQAGRPPSGTSPDACARRDQSARRPPTPGQVPRRWALVGAAWGGGGGASGLPKRMRS